MPYRIYLRSFDGTASRRTLTADPEIAADAFARLVNRTDLDSQNLTAVLTVEGRELAKHRFDRSPGRKDYWRGRLHEIDWPDRPPFSPAESKSFFVDLDPRRLENAKRLGDGDVAEGIRRALDLAGTP